MEGDPEEEDDDNVVLISEKACGRMLVIVCRRTCFDFHMLCPNNAY